MKRIIDGEIKGEDIERVMIVDELEILFVKREEVEGRDDLLWPEIKILEREK